MAQVDPEVCRLKYEQEVNRLTDQRALLQERGIFLLDESSFPAIDLLFVPRFPLQVAVSIPASGIIALPPGAFAAADVPALSACAFQAHFDLTDYDLRAPSLEFHDPWTKKLLPYGTMFRAFEYEKERKAHVVLLDAHPITHKPFLCLRGIREYHEHPQHSGDNWLLYRGQMNLFSIVLSVWRATIDIVRPVLIPQPNGIQVQWNAQEKD